ncbi:MAG: stage III sporulation protein AF [Zhaonellaceae bacterium]|jgi:stage III sporulation protein AF|nr:stage III sporulation protein AF [Clostridia bacterium]
MEIIASTIKNVVLIVFFASVIEMFLPRSSISRYVQLIMGLFVIVSILNPIANIKANDLQLKILSPSKTEQSQITKGINNGLNFKEINLVFAQDTVISNLEKQVEALVTIVPGVKEAKVKIVTDPEFINNGEIDKILIEIKSNLEKENDSSVEIVQIDTLIEHKNIIELFPEESKQQIKTTVSNFYGLDENLIEVITN